MDARRNLFQNASSVRAKVRHLQTENEALRRTLTQTDPQKTLIQERKIIHLENELKERHSLCLALARAVYCMACKKRIKTITLQPCRDCICKDCHLLASASLHTACPLCQTRIDSHYEIRLGVPSALTPISSSSGANSK